MTNEQQHELWSRDYWEDRYGAEEHVWSGRVNPTLVERAADLPVPEGGRALDLGCGEGADAIWLASRGWHVTGLDLAQNALDRAAAAAARAEAEDPALAGLGERLTWQQADLFAGDPGVPAPGAYDLVSAQFFHTPAALFADVYQRIAAAVRAGGSLLVVAHHPDVLATATGPGSVGSQGRLAEMISPEMVLDAVVAPAPAGTWEVRTADTLVRTQLHHGVEQEVTDSVVHLVRAHG